MNQLKVELDDVTDIEQLTQKIIDRHLELVVKNQQLPLFLLGELNATPKHIELLRRVVSDHPVFGDFFPQPTGHLTDRARAWTHWCN